MDIAAWEKNLASAYASYTQQMVRSGTTGSDVLPAANLPGVYQYVVLPDGTYWDPNADASPINQASRKAAYSLLKMLQQPDFVSFLQSQSNANVAALNTQITALNTQVAALQARLVVEPWTAVAAYGTSQPDSVFLNSWANYGGGFMTAGYYKDPFGVVHLRGTVSGTSPGAFLNMYLLPAAYRPSSNLWFASGATNLHCRITVASTGYVFMEAADSATPWDYVSLDGITFDTR
jgi:hypothetical protein